MDWKAMINAMRQAEQFAAGMMDTLKKVAGVPSVCPECGRSVEVRVMYVRQGEEMVPVMNVQCRNVPTCLWAKDYKLP